MVSVVLWTLRHHDFTRRIRWSVLGVTFGLGTYLILLGAGYSWDDVANKIVIAVTILLFVNLALQFIDWMFWRYLSSRRRRVPLPRLLVDLFNAIVLLTAALAILNGMFQVDLNALLVTSTVASAVIGLALQDTLGNLIAGLALQMDRPFDVGDWIHTQGQEGEVVQMNWRTISLRTIDDNAIILSNANIVRNDVINYSRPTPVLRMHVKIGMSYGEPPSKVKQVFLQTVRQVDGVLQDPSPDVLITDYADSSIVYDIRYWIKDYAHSPEIRDAIFSRAWYAIARAGMSVPFPIRDLNVRQISENYEMRIQEKLRDQVFTHLRPLPVFSPLTDEQIAVLSHRAKLHQFTQGEYIVRQGDSGDSLFVIKSGRVRVDVEHVDGRTVTVATRGPAEFFGEMSLFTGASRSASVIAEMETEVVTVCKDDLARAIESDFGRLAAMAQVIESRMQEANQKITAAVEVADRPDTVREDTLLKRIQTFFGL